MTQSSPMPGGRQSRRNVLGALGASLSLPWFASHRLNAAEAAPAIDAAPRRMVCIGNMLGFYPEEFWPDVNPKSRKSIASGVSQSSDFQFKRTCQSLDSIRDQLTVISGLDHDLSGGHFAIHSFLSGVRQIDAKSMPMANVTIDQYAAEYVPGQTRFPTLTIGSETGIHGGCQLSWTRSGTRVPPIPGPQQLFEALFVGSSEKEKSAQAARFELQRSILDLINDDAKDLRRQLNRSDQHKLEQYLTSVRDVERRIGMRRAWIDVAKPKAPGKQPNNRNMVEDLPLLYDLIVLALQSDSTRIATLEIGGDFNPRDLGISGGYHGFSHHGQRPEAIEALVTLETYQMEQFARFVTKLAQTQSAEQPLLDQTTVLFGSGMGNANSHTNTNLPVILCGGDFRHGRVLEYDREQPHRPPLTNLFLSMLQQFGIETDRFATSTGTLRGLA